MLKRIKLKLAYFNLIYGTIMYDLYTGDTVVFENLSALIARNGLV